MILLSFRNVVSDTTLVNFNKYYEDKKFSDIFELLYRI